MVAVPSLTVPASAAISPAPHCPQTSGKSVSRAQWPRQPGQGRSAAAADFDIGQRCTGEASKAATSEADRMACGPPGDDVGEWDGVIQGMTQGDGGRRGAADGPAADVTKGDVAADGVSASPEDR